MHFLHSPEWRDIQRRDGRRTESVAFHGRAWNIFRHDLPFGYHYWYLPRSPTADGVTYRHLAERFRRDPYTLFLRVEPLSPFSSRSIGLPVVATHSIQPEATTVIDLARSEAELRGLLHPKTRYNIGVALRRHVSARPAHPANLREFLSLLRETAERENFHPHPAQHYQNLIGVGSPHFSNELFIARYRDRPAAGAIVNFFRDTATYLHGASSNRLRSVMAPHLLHWEIIKSARARGMRWYDLWGVNDERYPGVSRFKRSFGGGEVRYPPAVDIVFRPWWYRAYRLRQGEWRLSSFSSPGEERSI